LSGLLIGFSFAYTFNGREKKPNKNKTASQCFPESMMKALFRVHSTT
jgi:hypothetical protein